MCITSRVRQREFMFLYPGLNYEEEELPCCLGGNYNTLFICCYTAEVEKRIG